MGLDVGVVKISYLERPSQPIYDFLWHVVDQAGCDGETWGSAWEGNAFVELPLDTMLTKAQTYIQEHNLSQTDSDKLIAWVRGLPWKGDTAMLHLNW